MKKIFTLISAFLFIANLFAQAPQKMSYQAVIRDADGNLVSNRNVEMRISIMEDTEDGYVVYAEIQTPQTNANGLVSFEIGYGEGFNKIDWSAGPYLLIIETDPKGGSNYTITGTSQLSSVPYALYAKTAETISGTIPEADPVFTTWDKDYADLTNKPDVSVYATKNMANQNITNLATPVNSQDAATKAYVDALLERIEELETLAKKVKDLDGNLYSIVKIGTQVWLGENLKTSTYNDGTSIPLVTDNIAWGNLSTPGYCWYNNDAATYKATYGALYNWHTVNTGKLCPSGWHVPTDSEWTTLTNFLGGLSIAGEKLKEAGTSHWAIPNTDATNETGFTALPGGFRTDIGAFTNIRDNGLWWPSSESSLINAWYRSLYNNKSNVGRYDYLKIFGFSVRCVKDN